jgi:peptidoglycan-associated lipoprotein
MKRYGLIFLGFVSLLSVTGCHKAARVGLVPAPATAPQAAPVAAQPKPAPATASTGPAATRALAAQPTAPAKMTSQERATLTERLAKLEDALFDYDKTAIRSDAMEALRSDVEVIRGILSNYPAQKLLIEGHADERGSSEYNLGLGDKRADSAQDFLATMGIPKQQLSVVSFGKERPVCTESTEACWQRNRRVHITAAP